VKCFYCEASTESGDVIVLTNRRGKNGPGTGEPLSHPVCRHHAGQATLRVGPRSAETILRVLAILPDKHDEQS
jgi:hypothetical protein